MPYLILGLGVVVGVAMLWSWAINANPRALARAIKTVAAILAIGLAVAAVLIGNPAVLLGLIPALLPLLMNTRALANRARAARGPSGGQTSTVQTDTLRAELDHETGAVRGTILTGPHAGAALEDLDLAQILAVMVECRERDPRTVSILEAYLDRRFGPDWRDGADGAASDDHGQDDADPYAAGGERRSRWGRGRRGGMSRDEAYAVLGLRPGASAEEVKSAHRRLMKQMHPDQGGSGYLAAKLNEAKAVLLDR